MNTCAQDLEFVLASRSGGGSADLPAGSGRVFRCNDPLAPLAP